MSMRKIWFGVPRYMQWIEPFTTAPSYERKGRSEFTQYLNGGTGRTGSLANHMEYTVSWNANKRDALRPIMDYAEGIYGDDYLYWIDPVAADKNVLPQAWATPWLASKDAQPLLFETRPKAIENADFSQGYPAFMARYEVTADSTPAPLFVPIPPGYTAWVGAHGNAGSGGAVQVTPTGGDAVILDILGVDDPVRFTESFTAADYDTAAGITLSLSKDGIGTIDIAGMVVQILPNGQAPVNGPFISGRGNSGCKFDSPPIEVPIMVPDDVNDLITLSAKLIEVGQWENVTVDLPSPVTTPASTWQWAGDPANAGYLIMGFPGAPTWVDDDSDGYESLGPSSTVWILDPDDPEYLIGS